jgi:hypothetical protein
MASKVRQIMGSSVPMMRAANQSMRAYYSADLSKHDRLMELLETYYKVHLRSEGSSENYGDMLSWCLENSQGKFRDLRHGDGMDWYFEHEEDATVFALKWT